MILYEFLYECMKHICFLEADSGLFPVVRLIERKTGVQVGGFPHLPVRAIEAAFGRDRANPRCLNRSQIEKPEVAIGTIRHRIWR